MINKINAPMMSKIISNVSSLANSITSLSLNAFLATLSGCPWDDESGDFPIGSFPVNPGFASVLFEANFPSLEVEFVLSLLFD